MAEALYRELRVLDIAPDAGVSRTDARSHCCERMRAAVTHECEQHANSYDCPDCLVVYNPVFDEYGIVIHDGGASYLLIAHCPWCGAKLPEPKRDRYFDLLDARGLSLSDDDLPVEFKSDAWWRSGETNS